MITWKLLVLAVSSRFERLAPVVRGVLFLSMLATCHAHTYTVTAYCGCKKCCGKYGGLLRTASGSVATEGRTCAAPRSIPFGSKLCIDGVGVRIVEDRLAKRFDDRIDIYFNDHKKALQFGRKRVTAFVVACPSEKVRIGKK